MGRSRQLVDEWVKRYRRQGLAGLEPGKAKGNPPSLTPEQQAAFKAPIERVWAYLRSHFLSNRVYQDCDDLFDETSNACNRLDESTRKSITATEWMRRTT